MSQSVPPETVALVRRRYAKGDSVAAIMEDAGITSAATLYACLDGRYADGSGAALPLPRRRQARPSRRGGGQRKALVARIWRNAEAQVQQIEARLAQSGLGAEDMERDARSLAVVVRTLRELASLDAAKRNREAQQQNPNDTPVPRDLGELRRQLARKLEALIEDDVRARDRSRQRAGETPR